MGNDEGWKVGDSASYLGRTVKITKVYPIGDPKGRFQVDGKTNIDGNHLHIVKVAPHIYEILKDKKILIELLWCFLGGLGFVVLTTLFENGATFGVTKNIFDLNYWGRYGDNTEEFIFGFIITGIIIWSIKTYKKL